MNGWISISLIFVLKIPTIYLIYSFLIVVINFVCICCRKIPFLEVFHCVKQHTFEAEGVHTIKNIHTGMVSITSSLIEEIRPYGTQKRTVNHKVIKAIHPDILLFQIGYVDRSIVPGFCFSNASLPLHLSSATGSGTS